MKRLKRLLGFDHPYSWTKWLRMGALGVALLVALVFWPQFSGLGFFGFIFMLILFGPTFLILLGATMLLGLVIGGVQSGKKQAASFRESAAAGEEYIALDKKRARVQSLQLLFKVLCGVLPLISLAAYIFLEEEMQLVVAPFFIVLWIVAFVVFGRLRRQANEYSGAFKEKVVRRALEDCLDNVNYRPGERFPAEVINASRLFPKFDSYHGNDLLEADCNGIHFTQADVHLLEAYKVTYTDKNGDTQTETKQRAVFQGRLMVFHYDALSNEPVFVFDKAVMKKAGDIQMELEAFNRRFAVRADDTTAAFRILTPPVLEGITMAAEKLDCPLMLSFLDDKIYIALANGDTLEATIHGDETLSRQRERIGSEIQTLVHIVECLYLKKEGGKEIPTCT